MSRFSTPSCSTSESPVLPDILLVGSQQSLDDPGKPLPEKVESTDSGFCSKSDSPTPISSQTSSQQTSDTSTAAHPEIEKEQTTPQTTTPNGEITRNCKEKHFHGGTKDDGENAKVEGLRERLSKWRSLPQLNKGEETECNGHARMESVTANESHKQRSRSGALGNL
ncbi:unnamed protein product [Cylicostephanus goldi]|uniref:Uncharacterized protein n=1 Tax=Cylicostephanus goldi TaxID=71465 RepID=A0A3P7P3Q0_CYLGO|nr:unnamed protein product [Cylicostephanus goldi]